MEKSKQPKTAFVLEGGAMRGLYSAGVLDVFMQNNISTDAIYGVSAGALFGINFKSKQIGRAIRYNIKYAHEKNYMGLYSLITTGNIMNKEFCFDRLVNELDKFDFDTFNNSPIDFFAVVYTAFWPVIVDKSFSAFSSAEELSFSLPKPALITILTIFGHSLTLLYLPSAISSLTTFSL